MTFDRDAFFGAYREAFGPITQPQVDGLNAILDAIEKDEEVQDIRHIAYMLATTKHECADTWQPITERGNRAYFDKYEPGTSIGRNLGNTQKGDGFTYRGRGYVQLTGRPNYQKMAEVCEADLTAHPDLALTPAIAYQIMSHGFRNGTFTGRKITHYINDQACDYRSARQCINRLDQADKIASYARTLEGILQHASSTEPA